MISDRVSPRLATWLKSSSAVDQLHAGVVAALDREGEQRAGALRADRLDPVVIGRGGQPGIGHALDARVVLQPFGDLLGVLHMASASAATAFRSPSACNARACGFIVMPRSRSPMAMPWKVKASGPKRLVELEPVIGGLGLGRARGTCPMADQSNLPLIDDRSRRSPCRCRSGIWWSNAPPASRHARSGGTGRAWRRCCRRSAACRRRRPPRRWRAGR